ncbi:hypothetical protein DSY2204 [Desulfitobacterium hafniense Y51]|uniref:Uncharacterized protein n=1 Tax=Desulfitobacterium hafniense (strain Y51) TaxID=138119 RepID=Q24VE9_DESHY|nr:hypothetical protein DSY2204 [Desulfitobacterium hafniense Y51]
MLAGLATPSHRSLPINSLCDILTSEIIFHPPVKSARTCGLFLCWSSMFGQLLLLRLRNASSFSALWTRIYSFCAARCSGVGFCIRSLAEVDRAVKQSLHNDLPETASAPQI